MEDQTTEDSYLKSVTTNTGSAPSASQKNKMILLLISIIILSIFSTAGIWSTSFGFNIWGLMTIVWAAVSILYRDSVGKFILILFITVVISNVILTLLFGPAVGWILLFYITNTYAIIKAAISGFIITKVYYWLIGDKILATKNKILLLTIFSIAFFITIIYILNGVHGQKEESGVTFNKTDFISKVVIAIGKNEITKFTNEELISIGVPLGTYKIEGNRIINNYGGDVIISMENSNVHLLYTKIPSKETCFNFYYMNNPKYNGFPITKIDGAVMPSSSSRYEVDDFMKKVCFSGKKTVDIEFVGTMQDIFKEADQIKYIQSRNSR